MHLYERYRCESTSGGGNADAGDALKAGASPAIPYVSGICPIGGKEIAVSPTEYKHGAVPITPFCTTTAHKI